MFVGSIAKNLLCCGLTDTRHVLQQINRGSVQIYTDQIYYIFYDFLQFLLQNLLIHIMLVHPDPHVEHWDFYDFTQTIYVSSTDRDSTSLGGVVVREFFISGLGSGVHRGSCFVYYAYFMGFKVLGDKVKGFSGSGSVSNNDYSFAGISK